MAWEDHFLHGPGDGYDDELPDFGGPGYGCGAPDDGLSYAPGGEHCHVRAIDVPVVGATHTHLIDGKRWRHDHDGPCGWSRNASLTADDDTEE